MSYRSARSEITRPDPMQAFANFIVTELEKGVKPWVRPWDPDKCAGPHAPMNPTSGKVYHGINVLILGMNPRSFQTGDPRFCTYQQAKAKGWQVRKDEKSTTIFFTKPYDVKDDEAEGGKKTIRFLKAFSVFHASQIDGIPQFEPPKIEEAPWRSIDATETIMRNSGAVVRVGGDRAFYSPSTDHIQMPPSLAFKEAAEEATTKIHEGGHWTGHKKRLDRDLTGGSAHPLTRWRSSMSRSCPLSLASL